MTVLEQQGSLAKEAARILAITKTDTKNKALEIIRNEINARRAEWLKANEEDMRAARENGMSESLLDRLKLTEARIDGILKGIDEIIALEDPVGKVLSTDVRPNGLKIEKRSVPMGVIAIIYEARPNVTVDAAVLTLKSGNAVILRGGREAFNSNLSVVNIMQDALEKAGLPRMSISLVENTSHESAEELMHLNEYVDVLIPRGGKNLIRNVVKKASVPVIRTGEGVCHIYVDEHCDLDMAAKILFNAKCSRPSVCNAVECVLVHEKVLKEFMPKAIALLDAKQVELRCDEAALAIVGDRGMAATEEDWDTEYGDYILSVKTVSDVSSAISFIMAHTTGHSEAVITDSAEVSERFLNEIDAAAVYVNASTRFTDGGEFGLGAEIGISTQKLHARGPMGLMELTSYKYAVTGNGQVR